MAARSKARKRALDILFEAEIRGEPVLALLDERVRLASPPVSDYAAELVRGVQAHRSDIDALLAEHAVAWTLDRMPAVDRNLLRIGAYELLYSPDVPDAVAISEAVALARELSTDSSPAFVNGLLARLHQLGAARPAAQSSAEAPAQAPAQAPAGAPAGAVLHDPGESSADRPENSPRS